MYLDITNLCAYMSGIVRIGKKMRNTIFPFRMIDVYKGEDKWKKHHFSVRVE